MFSDQINGFRETQKNFLRELLYGKTIAYIPSMSDYSREYFVRTKMFYDTFGAKDLFYVDVDEEYRQSNDELVRAADIIHLSGGKITSFASNLYKRGYDRLLEGSLRCGKLLIGVSAGAIIMGPDLSIANIYEKDEGIERPRGLNFVNFHFAPHIDDYLEKLKKFKSAHSLMPCRDSEMIYVRDGRERYIY